MGSSTLGCHFAMIANLGSENPVLARASEPLCEPKSILDKWHDQMS